MSNHETLRLQVFSVLVRPTTAFQPRRLMMAPAAVGCKRLLDGSYAHIGAREGKHAPTIKGSGTPDSVNSPRVYSSTAADQKGRPARLAAETRTTHCPDNRIERKVLVYEPTVGADFDREGVTQVVHVEPE